MKKTETLKMLLKLYGVFFKIGSVTFGGGLAMLPILENEVVDKRKWATREQLTDYYAISQVTPGIIAVNVATFLGFNLAGILGGIFATLGVVSPSIIIITAISYFIENFSSIEWVQSALSGINVAVCGLLTVAVVSFVKTGMKACNVFLSIFLMLVSFFLIAFLHVPSAIVIVLGSLVGIVIHAFNHYLENKRKNKSDQGGEK
mgnify:CR=1 FL=1